MEAIYFGSAKARTKVEPLKQQKEKDMNEAISVLLQKDSDALRVEEEKLSYICS